MRLGLYPAALRGLHRPPGLRRRPDRRAAPAPLRVNNAYRDQLEGGRPGVLRDLARQQPGGVRRAAPRGAPYYIATQAHPELRSRPTRPHPLFKGPGRRRDRAAEGSRFPIDETGLRREIDDPTTAWTPDRVPPELADTPEEWPVAESRVVYDGGWVVRMHGTRCADRGTLTRSLHAPGGGAPGRGDRAAGRRPDRVLCLAVPARDRPAAGAAARGAARRPGEDPLEAARRELLEGGRAGGGGWTHLTSTYSSPGFTSGLSHYYLARGITTADRGDFEPAHEEAEMEAAWVPFAELHEAVLRGGSDAHLAVAVLSAGSRLAPVPRRSGADHRRSST